MEELSRQILILNRLQINLLISAGGLNSLLRCLLIGLYRLRIDFSTFQGKKFKIPSLLLLGKVLFMYVTVVIKNKHPRQVAHVPTNASSIEYKPKIGMVENQCTPEV